MKGLPNNSYLVEAFKTHKTQTYGHTYLGGSNSPSASVNLAVNTPFDVVTPFYTASDPVNPSGIYKRPLYASLRQLFYTSASLDSTGMKRTDTWAPTGSQVYVVSLAQQTYGENILPGSFRLTATLSTASIFDDGVGNLVSTEATQSVIGHIFYEQGLAVIQQDITPISSSILTNNGLWLATGSALNIQFNATHTIYQHVVICTMDIGDFNYSLNPSSVANQSVYGNVRVTPFDAMASGSLTPYMTSVGLYSDSGDLVAVAKFPRPIKRAVDSQQTVIVKFDV